MTVTNSPLTKPYPSDPSKRYRQAREGQRAEGTATNQVWTVTLNATGGLWFCTVRTVRGKAIDPNISSHIAVSPVANAATMQAFFESQVGAGNVTVTGGPGASGGGTPYVITFIGELAGQPFFLDSSAVFMSGGAATATLVNTTPGGVVDAVVPIGPDLSTNTALPHNAPVAREA